MKLIKEGILNVLVAEEEYKLRDKNEILEEGKEPYLTDKMYPGKSITTLEQCEEIWEEVRIDENQLESEN